MTKEKLRASFTKIYVEGHADDDNQRELTLVELLNVRADEIAENIAQQCIRGQTKRVHELPRQLQGCTGVYIKGHWIGSSLGPTL